MDFPMRFSLVIQLPFIAWVDEIVDRHYILMMLTRSILEIGRQSIDEWKSLAVKIFHESTKAQKNENDSVCNSECQGFLRLFYPLFLFSWPLKKEFPKGKIPSGMSLSWLILHAKSLDITRNPRVRELSFKNIIFIQRHRSNLINKEKGMHASKLSSLIFKRRLEIEVKIFFSDLSEWTFYHLDFLLRAAPWLYRQWYFKYCSFQSIGSAYAERERGSDDCCQMQKLPRRQTFPAWYKTSPLKKTLERNSFDS